MTEKNSKVTYSEQLDTIAEWEWFLNVISTFNIVCLEQGKPQVKLDKEKN